MKRKAFLSLSALIPATTFILSSTTIPAMACVTSSALKPSATTSSQNQAIHSLYNTWKKNLRQNSYHGWWAVRADAQNGQNPYVAEGQGYGLTILAQMAPYDSNARMYFDGITKFVLDHPSSINRNLHAATQDGNMVSTGNKDCATDGDMDIAMGLLMGHARWGSSGKHNYRELALTRINAIRQSLISPETGLLRMGDWSHSHWDQISRTSDWMIGHFEAFHRATNDDFWLTISERHREATRNLQANHSPSTGLLPDFAKGHSYNVHPASAYTLEGPHDGKHYYNACRTPWRLGASGNTEAREMSARMAMWAHKKCNGNINTLPTGYNLDGSNVHHDIWQDMAFIGPFAVGARWTNNQEWMNTLWDFMASRTSDSNYYPASIQLLSMILINGTYTLNP